jgi:hypothetical protein
MKKTILLLAFCSFLFFAPKIHAADVPASSNSGMTAEEAQLINITDLSSPPVASTGEFSAVSLSLPAIYVTNATLNNVSDNTFSGSITVKNKQKEAFGDLQYQMVLLAPATVVPNNKIIIDSTPEYDRVISSDTFSILGESEKKIDFTYHVPAVPAGEYRLRLQVLTSKGWELGWKDLKVEIKKSENTPQNFVLAAPVSVLPEGQKTESDPTSGVNVAPNSKLSLKFLINKPQKDLTLTPELSVWEFAGNRAKIATIKGEPIKVIKGGSKIYSIPAVALEKPEAYYAEISLLDQDGKKSSNTISYRWVVEGESAEITVGKIEKPAYKNGETMVAVAEIIGAADRKTVSKVAVEAVLTDEGRVVSTQKTDYFDLANSTRVVKINIPLAEDVFSPEVTLKIVSQSGKVLDEDLIKLPVREGINKNNVASVPPPVKKGINNFWLLGIAAILIVCLVAILRYLKRTKKDTIAKNITTLLVILFLCGLAVTVKAVAHVSSGWQTIDGVGKASYEVWCYGNWQGSCVLDTNSRFFNNSPTLGETYSTVSNINDPTSPYVVPVEGYVLMHACQNSWTNGKLKTATSANTTPVEKQTWSGSFSPDCNALPNSCTIVDGHPFGYRRGNFTGNITYPRSSGPNAWLQAILDEKFVGDGSNESDFLTTLQIDFLLAQPVTAGLTVNGQHPTVASPLLITPTEATTPVAVGWSSTNATSCTASSNPASPWIGTKGVNGSEPSVGLNAGTNYALTITCNGEGGATATDTVYVNVGSLPLTCTQSVSGSNVTFTGTGGISTYPIYKFYEEGVKIPDGDVVGNTYSTTLSNATGKIYTVQRCDSPTAPPCTAAPSTKSWGGSVVADFNGLREVVNANSVTKIKTVDPQSGTVMFQNEIAQKICEWSGYATVAEKNCHEYKTTGRCNFTSPWNNTLGKWNQALRGGLGDVQVVGADTPGAQWLGYLKCSDPICPPAPAQTCEDATCPAALPNPTVTLSAAKNPVDYNSATTLTWTTANATSCTASGDWSGGKSATGGNESTGNLTTAKTYTLTCSNGVVDSAPSSVTVNVNSAALSCSASPANVYTGSDVTFTASGSSSGIYTWDPLSSGATPKSGYSFSSNPMKAKFTTPGSKTVRVSSVGAVDCTASVNVNNRSIPGDIQEI